MSAVRACFDRVKMRKVKPSSHHQSAALELTSMIPQSSSLLQQLHTIASLLKHANSSERRFWFVSFSQLGIKSACYCFCMSKDSFLLLPIAVFVYNSNSLLTWTGSLVVHVSICNLQQALGKFARRVWQCGSEAD